MRRIYDDGLGLSTVLVQVFLVGGCGLNLAATAVELGFRTCLVLSLLFTVFRSGDS